jgi:hypothetical protein
MPMNVLARTLGIALALVACAGVRDAHAQEGAIVVVVDSSERSVQADAVRVALAAQVELDVLSLLDDQREGTIGTLQVAVATGGRHVELCYQAQSGRRRFHTATAPRGASGAGWVAEAAAAFVSHEVSDRRWALPTEVLDPFSVPRARGAAPSEVIDPWDVPWSRATRAAEQGTELAPPPRTR